MMHALSASSCNSASEQLFSSQMLGSALSKLVKSQDGLRLAALKPWWQNCSLTGFPWCVHNSARGVYQYQVSSFLH